MCLTKIKDFKIHNYYGYKVMYDAHEHKLASMYYRDNFDNMILDIWYKDIDERDDICTDLDTSITYKSGFHIYRLKEYAKFLSDLFEFTRLVKVKFRDVITKGVERERDVIVARQIKIVKIY